MDELTPETPRKRGPLFFVGAAGLLCMMLVEAAAVIGRHIGMPVMGALEIVQFAIVPAACASMLIATLQGAHAAVHMITERMPQSAQGVALRIGSALAGACFATLTVGSAWLAFEYWNTFEQTEVLDLSLRPLRLLITLAAAALTCVFFHRAVRRKTP
jgi:TRAP-type C4-dicarboxylate transport system permease small subunit